MRMTTTSIICLAVGMGSALAKEPGIWVKNSNFAQMHTACIQSWMCSPAKDILHSQATVVVTSKPTYSLGVCGAGNGPINSCNVCVAREPTDKCEWWLEKIRSHENASQ